MCNIYRAKTYVTVGTLSLRGVSNSCAHIRHVIGGEGAGGGTAALTPLWIPIAPLLGFEVLGENVEFRIKIVRKF